MASDRPSTLTATSRDGGSCIETPFYVVDRGTIRHNVREFRRAFPRMAIYYAMKANPEPCVLEALSAEVDGFEIASTYELETLLALGVAPGQVIFGSAVKAPVQIAAAHCAGVTRFAADSPGEVEKIALNAPGAGVHLRIQVDDAGSVFAFSEKFGAAPDRILDLARLCVQRGVTPYGLSFHVGSQATRSTAWAEALDVIEQVQACLITAGLSLNTINIGGGFPCQYDSDDPVPSIDQISASLGPRMDQFDEQTSWVAEPGRFLVASAVRLVVSVIGKSERAGTPWLFLDAGCYNGLFEAMSYQGRTRYGVSALRGTESPSVAYSLAGPTGDSADIIARQVHLPSEMNVGDQLIVERVGAYTMSLSVPFNGFPRPRLVVV